MITTDTPTFHGVDNEEIICHYNILESRISPELKMAEERLQKATYTVVRHVRNGVVFGLETFGQDFHDLEKVRSILGGKYKLLLNTNCLKILIK